MIRKYYVSEASVYRLLKAHDLITSPAFIVIKAADEFRDKTTAINQLWQTDFTYLSAHMRLTYLAPGVVKDLFEGRQPEALTAARLVSLCKDLPHDWQLQRDFLGFGSQ